MNRQIQETYPAFERSKFDEVIDLIQTTNGKEISQNGWRLPATEKPKEAVEYAIEVETKNCVWSVNTGFDAARTAWTIDNSVENDDIEKDKKPTVEQVSNAALAKEAVEAAGGPVTIGNCKD